jgi:hypothetical protein
LFVEASRQLAARSMREASRDDGRLDAITLWLLGRRLGREERAVVRRTLEAARATYRGSPALARDLLQVGASMSDPTLPPVELAAWTLVASQVMNLDESLTK